MKVVYPVQVLYAKHLRWHRAGRTLLIEGRALHPGTFTGIDGHTITYPPVLFKKPGSIEIIERRIKYQHENSDEAVVGFITGYDVKPDGLYIRGYVFDEDVAELVRNGEIDGLSIEAEVDVDDENVAKHVKILAVALVPSPAAPKAEVTRAKVVAVLSNGNSEISEEVRAMSVETKKKPTREEFFKWIKQQLKNAKVPDDVIDTVMDVLDKAIKTPYPYPYPYPAPKLEEVEKLKQENETLKKQVEELKSKLEQVQIEAEVNEIRSVEPEFKPETVISENMTFEAKMAALEAYKKALKTRVKLSVSQDDTELERKVESILREIGFEGENA